MKFIHGFEKTAISITTAMRAILKAEDSSRFGKADRMTKLMYRKSARMQQRADNILREQGQRNRTHISEVPRKKK